MLTIKGQNALVVGGGRGIGAAIAEYLALKGADVWIFDTDKVHSSVNHYQTLEISGYKSACVLCDKLTSKGLRLHALNVDACSEDSVVEGIMRIADKSGSLSILVNAIGTTHMSNTIDTTLAEFMAIIQTNLAAPYITCREVAKMMISSGKGGSIINIGSISGKMGFPWISSYCAAKAGLHGFTSSLALELAEHRIQVNAVCPGIVKTNMWDYLQGKLKNKGENDEEFWSRMNEMIPQGHPQTLQCVANFVVAIIENDEITGQALSIDGGMNRYV